MDIIKEVENELIENNNLPDFKSGDTITVAYKIKEGSKERIQQFQGVSYNVKDLQKQNLLRFVKCLGTLVLNVYFLYSLHLLKVLQSIRKVVFVELVSFILEKELVNLLVLRKKEFILNRPFTLNIEAFCSKQKAFFVL